MLNKKELVNKNFIINNITKKANDKGSYWQFDIDVAGTVDKLFLPSSERNDEQFKALDEVIQTANLSISNVTLSERGFTSANGGLSFSYSLKTGNLLAPVRGTISFKEALFKGGIFNLESLEGRDLAIQSYSRSKSSYAGVDKARYVLNGHVDGRSVSVSISANKQTSATLEDFTPNGLYRILANTFTPKGQKEEIRYFFLDVVTADDYDEGFDF